MAKAGRRKSEVKVPSKTRRPARRKIPDREQPTDRGKPVEDDGDEACCTVVRTGPTNSALFADVEVGQGWNDRDDKLRSFRERIRQRSSWPASFPATSVALSEGAAISASVTPVARMRAGDDWIGRTEPQEVTADGTTTFQVAIEASDSLVRSQVAGAALYLIDTQLAIGGSESLESIQGLARVGDVVSSFTHPVAEAAYQAVISMGVNAYVRVAVDARVEMSIDPCPEARSELLINAERVLEMAGGAINAPADGEFGDRHCLAGLISGTGDTGMTARFRAHATLNGEARSSWHGDASLSSLWAVAWAACCGCEETDAGSEIVATSGETGWGFEFGFQLVLPPMDHEGSPSDLGAQIKLLLKTDLEHRLASYLGEGASCQAPEVVESLLRMALMEWQAWMSDELGLFFGAQYEDPEDEQDEDEAGEEDIDDE